MDVLAIELNDAAIRAARSNESALLKVDGEHRSSPGLAWIHQNAIETGMAAARMSARHPREVNSRFWDLLDTGPIDAESPRSPNRAEVAFSQLEQIVRHVRHEDEALVIAVPPFYDQSQLGMIVSMARELELPLQGLVAGPIALDLDSNASGTILAIDLSLHRGVVSVLEAGDELRLERTRIAPDVGLHTFRRQWVKAIGEEFVRYMRFDPLHEASTEQQLHDQLTDTLEALATEGSAALSIQAGEQVHRVTLTEQALANAGHGLIFRLLGDVQAAAAGSRVGSILLTHQAARIPGLSRALRQQIAAPVHRLEAGAAALGLVALWPECFDQTAAPAIGYHTARALTPHRTTAPPAPAPESQSQREAEPPPPRAVVPTHLLAGDEAHPLVDETLFVRVDRENGRLLIGGDWGEARLRRNSEGVFLEVESPVQCRVDGVEVVERQLVGVGAEIAILGCSETMKLIAMRT